MKKIIFIIIGLLYINTVFGGGGGKVVEVETKLPIYVGENAGTYINDINYRKTSVVSIDQDLNEYLVIPYKGMVIPVYEINKNSKDYSKLLNFEYVDVNKYLKYGSLNYPNKKELDYGDEGNITIMGHSSYLKRDNGRYKTHFQVIIGLPIGEEIWIYKKENNNFKRYRYKITNSYQTDDEDISILENLNKKELTLFTCTPIGGDAWRWIVKSEYIEEYNNISEQLKESIQNNLIQKVENINDTFKRNVVKNKLIVKLENYKTNTASEQEIINYIIEELKNI